ncbi:MAG TPA: FGGY family carbohydrate kinase, partial [Gemmataceae bacterium]|nr:FGGY family carbohydrate kinase [Gemmataceae bacterium]
MPSAVPLFLGLDVGTQSVRAALFGLSGECRSFATSTLDTVHPQPGWAEQDARQWWQAACKAVHEALHRAGAKPDDIAAMGLDCTACTVIPCRRDGTPLRPALLWMDQRSFREAEDISATNDPILRYVSGVVSPEWMLPKALWLKRHDR